MRIVLEHRIVPVRDRDNAMKFYNRIFGFDDLSAVGPFLAVQVNDSLNFDFQASEEFQSIHYAFARIRESSISYVDRPYAVKNIQGPGMTMRAKDNGKAIHFKDPSGHVLEIRTY